MKLATSMTNNKTGEAAVQYQVEQLDEGLVTPEELVGLLKEQHAIYAQQSRAAVIRMRGWILYAFSRHNVPQEALPFVLEELESGIDPYTVAAAALAVTTVEQPETYLPYLKMALENMEYRDDKVSFDHYGAYLTKTEDLTARDIINASLPTLSPPSSCCSRSQPLMNGFSQHKHETKPIVTDQKVLDAIKFEDQQGETITFKEWFSNGPTLVVFFYTRCENPHKCPKTMTKLRRIQERIGDGTLQTAAITYDSLYDNPERLLSYGKTYGLQMSQQHRLLRACDNFDDLAHYFDLGVGRVGSTVNRHQVEAFIVDRNGQVVTTAQRLDWSEDQLLVAAKSCPAQ